MSGSKRFLALAIFAAGMIFAADRILLQEHNYHEQMHLERRLHAIARDASDFFSKRALAVHALAEATRQSNHPLTDERLGRRAAALFEITGDPMALRVVDSRGQALARWPQTIPNETLKPETMAMLNEAKVSGMTRMIRTGDQPPAVEMAGYAGTANDTDIFVLARFSLQPLAERLNDVSDGYRFSLLDEKQVEAVSAGNARIKGPEDRATVQALNVAWTVRGGEVYSNAYSLLTRRLALAGLGLGIACVFLVTLWLQSRQIDEVREENKRYTHIEDRNRAVVARLMRLNRELDEFTYVVSHDLKEPLRGVEGVARMFIEECGEDLGDAGREYLRSIQSSGERMRRLVDDLLRLSRVTRRRYPHEPVDFNDLVRDALNALDYGIQERHAQITVQPGLPCLVTDRVRMMELMHNLVWNALKFNGGREPVVEIGYEKTADEHLFWVKDNGTGVKAEDRERIFEIFQRGTDESSGEGTGIGLTICKRIVENLGGKIWVEPGAEMGSRFCFTLPAEAQPFEPEPAAGEQHDSAKAACAAC